MIVPTATGIRQGIEVAPQRAQHQNRIYCTVSLMLVEWLMWPDVAVTVSV